MQRKDLQREIQLKERQGSIRDFVPQSSLFGVKRECSLTIVYLQCPSCEHQPIIGLKIEITVKKAGWDTKATLPLAISAEQHGPDAAFPSAARNELGTLLAYLPLLSRSLRFMLALFFKSFLNVLLQSGMRHWKRVKTRLVFYHKPLRSEGTARNRSEWLPRLGDPGKGFKSTNDANRELQTGPSPCPA